MDDLRARLDAMPTAELVGILRDQDPGEWRPEVFPLVEAILRARGVDTDGMRAAGPRPPEEPAYQDVVRVSTERDPMAANLVRMSLEESGIPAWLSTEHLAGASPPLGIAIGLDVMVRAQDEGAAREVLAALESGAAALPLEPEPCPRCQSLQTEHRPERDRAAAVASVMLFETPRPAVVWRYRCGACGHAWE